MSLVSVRVMSSVAWLSFDTMLPFTPNGTWSRLKSLLSFGISMARAE